MSTTTASCEGAYKPSNGRHLSTSEFDGLMQHCGALGDKPHVAVAVSGGPDSIALTHLLNDWLNQRGGKLFAITIDHQLRAESATEAAQVHEWCVSKNITHVTLKWEKEHAPSSAIHQQARNARYELLMQACRNLKIEHLFVAHHADDQAETVMMRFLKGSGVDGLAGMPSSRLMDGIKLIRPLLPVHKHRLEATCALNGWAYVRDPSNESEAYLRGRLRNLAGPLAQEGVTTATLYEVARSAGLARATLEETTNQWLKQYAEVSAFGHIQIDMNAWKSLGDDMKRRVLIRVLLCMSGEDYPPKNASIEILVQNLLSKETPHQTLCGCQIIMQFGLIKFYREHAALPKAARLENNMLWDNRFRIITNSSHLASLIDKNLCIAPLGALGRELLEKMGYKQVADCAALHRATLPALYVDNQLHSVPEFTTEQDMTNNPQAIVKAIFLPKRLLLSETFKPCPALLG